ncbi:hypothetical protein, variant [Aphanomyces astaci]|uniref:Uncharacterized protein n=1 Tax=Aphanomyces astaci TaxID=112090 RepID=W4GZ12_APHAT|nr:hypothetical protein, variant [Aphanomyces astaci]ETV84254.1 hypothetical protein, variant [Aphanomyces astaci]|eukprot:XP_009825946.1 hypothetical protein, variant [Aphanomyces astaci]
MPRKPVPPRNFTHRHARKTVEISFEEYTHNKNEILGKIYRRLFWLACLATTFGLIELVVYIVITAMYTTTVEFRRPVLGVALKSVYLVYWGMSAVLCAHGFHLHLKWRHFLKDGTHLVMHCRLFEVLGLGWFFAASWLLGGIFHVFGFVDVSIIGANMQNILYAVAISTLLLQLVLCPWFFKTIHSKTTQIDDIYCAEFLGKTKIKHINVEPLTDLNDIPSDSEHDVNDIHVDNGSSSSSEGGASESSHHVRSRHDVTMTNTCRTTTRTKAMGMQRSSAAPRPCSLPLTPRKRCRKVRSGTCGSPQKSLGRSRARFITNRRRWPK